MEVEIWDTVRINVDECIQIFWPDPWIIHQKARYLFVLVPEELKWQTCLGSWQVKEEMLFEALTTRKTVTVGEKLIVPYKLAEVSNKQVLTLSFKNIKQLARIKAKYWVTLFRISTAIDHLFIFICSCSKSFWMIFWLTVFKSQAIEEMFCWVFVIGVV